MKKKISSPILPIGKALLLLTVLTLALAPHLVAQPLWYAITLSTLLLLRGVFFIRRWRMPRWILLPAALGMCFLVFKLYHTLIGRDGGLALLCGLVVFKLHEGHTLRDARLLLLLALFVTSSAFLLSQTPFTMLYVLATSIILLTCWLLLERPDTTFLSRLKLTLRLLVQGLPIALLLFVFFPRLSGPLWSMPLERGARSGLAAGKIDPGSISQMAYDDTIAFRVEFRGAQPPLSSLYWRALIYENFDGRSWYSLPPTFSLPLRLSQQGKSVSYTIILEPHQDVWLPALDLPLTAPAGTRRNNRWLVLSDRPVKQRLRYTLESTPQWQNKEDVTQSLALQLPEQGNPQARALAESWKSLPPAKRVAAGLAFFARNRFAYTLEPPALTSNDSIDEFLFKTRLGFCEHYASSFAFLMRAAGVPTRLVGGYLGGEFNPAGDYMIIRQGDAHAWTEVWLDETGWQRVDPTAMVAPTRIEQGLASSVPQSSDLPMMMQQGLGWLKNLRMQMDVAMNAWNQWVIGYDESQQISLLRRLGIDSVLAPRYLAWVGTLLSLVLGSLLWWHLRRRPHQHKDVALQLYQHWLSQMAKQGCPHQPSEAPQAYATRASLHLPTHAGLIQRITLSYLTLRYGEDPTALADLRQAVEDFQQQTKGASHHAVST